MEKTQATQIDSISKRLKNVIDTLGVKQSHMAEKLGLSPSGLHYILNNDVKSPKNTEKIIEYLNTTENFIAQPKVDPVRLNENSLKKETPLYYPDQLKFYYRTNKKETIIPNSSITSINSYKNSTIAIYMTEQGFIPKFELQDIILFEQVECFEDGEILLIYLKQSNEITVKYGFYKENYILLMSPYESPVCIQYEDFIIIGAYRECFKRTKF